MAHASVIFFWLAFLLYGAAFAVFLYHLFSRRSAMNSLGLALVVAGVACQTAAIVLRGVSAGRVPVVGAYESLSMVAWSIVLVYLVLELFTRIKAVGLYVMPIVLVLYYFISARRVNTLRRDVQLLEQEVQRRQAGAGEAGGE